MTSYSQSMKFPFGNAGAWFSEGRGRGRHHGFGGHRGMPPWEMFFGPGGTPPFPWGPPGKGRGPWRGPKARRGDVRAAILAVLNEQPRNGYQIIQEIAERSGGIWKPSPGSVYPTLQQLEDEGLVRVAESAGRRTFELTDDGRAYVAEHADETSAPWESMSAAYDDGDDLGLRPVLGQVASAMWQIMATGTDEQRARARDALADLRRRLYSILSEDDREGDE